MKIMNMTNKLRRRGFTLVEIMVVVAIIGLLMSVATVGINHAIKTAKAQTCNMNIEAIEGAKQMWMLESKKGDNDTCPSGGTYTINNNSTRATCSVHAAISTTGVPANQ